MRRVRAPRAPAGRIPRGPSSKTAPPGPRTERIQPPRRSLPSTRITWVKGWTLQPGLGHRGEGSGGAGGAHPLAGNGIRVYRGLPPACGTHLEGTGGPAQVVTGGQAADASTQHDHGPAHWERRGQADRAPSLQSLRVRAPAGPLTAFRKTKAELADAVVGARGARFGAQASPKRWARESEGGAGADPQASQGRYGPHPRYQRAARGAPGSHNRPSDARARTPLARAGAAVPAPDWWVPHDARQ